MIMKMMTLIIMTLMTSMMTMMMMMLLKLIKTLKMMTSIMMDEDEDEDVGGDDVDGLKRKQHFGSGREFVLKANCT